VRKRRRSAQSAKRLILSSFAGLLGVAAVLAVAAGMIQRQRDIDNAAMKSAMTLLARILDARNNQSLDLVVQRASSLMSEQFSTTFTIRTRLRPPIRCGRSLSALQSDLYAASENYEAARKSAETAIRRRTDASGIESEGQRNR